MTMVDAYLLIQAEPGPAGQAVSKKVAAVQGVLAAEDISGPYDVVARAQARDLDELAKLVVRRVQEIEGVTRVLTCPVVHL